MGNVRGLGDPSSSSSSVLVETPPTHSAEGGQGAGLAVCGAGYGATVASGTPAGRGLMVVVVVVVLL